MIFLLYIDDCLLFALYASNFDSMLQKLHDADITLEKKLLDVWVFTKTLIMTR